MFFIIPNKIKTCLSHYKWIVLRIKLSNWVNMCVCTAGWHAERRIDYDLTGWLSSYWTSVQLFDWFSESLLTEIMNGLGAHWLTPGPVKSPVTNRLVGREAHTVRANHQHLPFLNDWVCCFSTRREGACCSLLLYNTYCITTGSVWAAPAIWRDATPARPDTTHCMCESAPASSTVVRFPGSCTWRIKGGSFNAILYNACSLGI